jgi:hypothetical protein
MPGYNVRFDLSMVDEELRRCGLKLDLTGVNVIDALGIYQKKDPRNLSAAVMKYCGRSHDDAHGAAAARCTLTRRHHDRAADAHAGGARDQGRRAARTRSG